MAPGSAGEAVAPYAALLTRDSGSVVHDLDAYAALLGRWQAVQNLVSRETLTALWSRHVADSLQLLPLLRESDRIFLDIGSGGGFPALPLAIALKGGGRAFHLVEPNGRKASFLRTVARDLALEVTVHSARAEALDRATLPAPDVVTSRALAPLPDLLALVHPFWSPHTHALFHKGREHAEELAKSALVWQYDSVVIASAVENDGVVLCLSNLVARRR